MLQTFAEPVQAQPPCDRPDADLLEPLLRLAGPIDRAHALVVAHQGLELMCALARRGCLAATYLRMGDKPEAAAYDLILVPAALSPVDAMIRLVRRSLAANGRVVVGCVPGEAVPLARRLRLNGFTDLRFAHRLGQTLLRAAVRSVS